MPAFNRTYLQPEMEIGFPSGDRAADLGTLIFKEESPLEGLALFFGFFEIRTPDVLVGTLPAQLQL